MPRCVYGRRRRHAVCSHRVGVLWLLIPATLKGARRRAPQRGQHLFGTRPGFTHAQACQAVASRTPTAAGGSTTLVGGLRWVCHIVCDTKILCSLSLYLILIGSSTRTAAALFVAVAVRAVRRKRCAMLCYAVLCYKYERGGRFKVAGPSWGLL